MEKLGCERHSELGERLELRLSFHLDAKTKLEVVILKWVERVLLLSYKGFVLLSLQIRVLCDIVHKKANQDDGDHNRTTASCIRCNLRVPAVVECRRLCKRIDFTRNFVESPLVFVNHLSF